MTVPARTSTCEPSVEKYDTGVARARGGAMGGQLHEDEEALAERMSVFSAQCITALADTLNALGTVYEE